MLYESKLITTEDGGVLLDLEHDRMLKFNATAVFFWKELGAGKTDDQIVEEICLEHGTRSEQVRQDLHDLKTRICELGLAVSQTSTASRAPTVAVEGHLPSFPWYGAKQQRPEASNGLWTVFAWGGLLTFDCILSLLSMKSLCRTVESWPMRARRRSDEPSLLSQICHGVERACVWYPKKTLCLQRSAVTTCLLRFAGLPARLVIGAQPMPFQAHAWVEVEGSVVNDHKGVAQVYRVLSRY